MQPSQPESFAPRGLKCVAATAALLIFPTVTLNKAPWQLLLPAAVLSYCGLHAIIAGRMPVQPTVIAGDLLKGRFRAGKQRP